MRAVLEITPTSNYAIASADERSDSMQSLGRVLMGLSHSVQLIVQCRETTEEYDWPTPPRLTRRWLAVVTADDEGTLGWRARTLKKTLDGIGLRGQEVIDDIRNWGRGWGTCADCLRRDPSTLSDHLGVEVEPDCVFDGKDWCASLVLRQWPREVAPGWLGNALAGDLPVDVAIHIEPQDAQQVARFLKRQVGWQSEGKDAGDELGAGDADRVRRNLIARVDKPCKVAVVLTVRAPGRDQLRVRVETLRHEIGLTLADVRLAKFEQDRGLEATLPTGKCSIVGAFRTLDCTSVASTFIFQPPTVNHEHGADIGTTHAGSMLVRLDTFDASLESFGGIVLGKVGGGKSFFLKLVARRIRDAEVLIVEQRSPAEYTGVPGATTFNLADVDYAERADKLRAFVRDLWETAKRDPKPRLLILDELWSLLRDPALASLVEEIARIGRHHYLALWIATQQVLEMVGSEQGMAVLNNSAIRVYLKQHGPDGDLLADKMHLSDGARRFLRGATRGQALLDVGGLLVPVDIQASPSEHLLISTDPREKRAALVAA